MRSGAEVRERRLRDEVVRVHLREGSPRVLLLFLLLLRVRAEIVGADADENASSEVRDWVRESGC